MQGITIIGAVPVLRSADLPSYRFRPLFRYLDVRKGKATLKERSINRAGEQEVKPEKRARAIPPVSIPLWYRFKAWARERYYGRNKWAIWG